MFLTQPPFMEAPLIKEDADSAKNDSECMFGTENLYSELGLLTPPWSPSDSGAMDTCIDFGESLADTESAVAVSTIRARCDSFLCECSGLEDTDGPVLRDCMWSQTTGLQPPPSLVAPQPPDTPPDAGDGGDDCPPCCPSVATVCANHTDRCVDPKNVFPCQTAAVSVSNSNGTLSARSQPLRLQSALTSDYSVTKSPVYDPDSETSAYCSSFSDKSLTVNSLTGQFADRPSGERVP